jgi:hypothetical protein
MLLRPLLLLACLGLAACGAQKSDDPAAPDPGAGNPDSGAPAETGPTEVDGYPVGPYGMKVGQVFPDLTLEGYRDGKGDWVELAVRDYYDPTGDKGIRGLYLTVSAPWCAACQGEAKSLPGMYDSKYRASGARFLTAIVQDADSKPAGRATVDAWVSTYKTNYDVAADGAMTTVPRDATGGGSIALPYNYVIDPRTMRITQINAGPVFYGAQIPGLDPLLKRNGAR